MGTGYREILTDVKKSFAENLFGGDQVESMGQLADWIMVKIGLKQLIHHFLGGNKWEE